MCGIVGIVDLHQRPLDRAVLERMCGALRHRGPDDEGFVVAAPAALGQRRLSILDLAGGKQPLSNEDGTVWITFNGEIYNFKDLRDRLIGLGHRFATQSDTEVIVHAYEEYGADCVEHLRGMFAFGIWDSNRQQLFLARDRVGKKPLFYTRADGCFLFASELQGLLTHPAIPRDVDPAGIDAYLTYGYVPAPRTIFRDVWKLPPAHHLTLSIDKGTGRVEERLNRYWQLDYAPKLALDENEAAEALLDVLTEAVRMRMVADVPVGALLSGGIDSSLVVAIMSRVSNRPVQTFSIGFDEKEFDELRYARLVADRHGTDHHELIVRPTAVDVLPMLVRHYGEPFADSSAVPSYHVAKMTRQHVTVALNGDGGDECFAGYERYLGGAWADHYRRIPEVLRRRFIEPLSRLVPKGLPRQNRLGQVRRFLGAAGLPTEHRHLRWVSVFRTEVRHAIYNEGFRQELADYDAGSWLTGLYETLRSSGLNGVDSLLALDVVSYLPYDLLVKMDIATMAASLEARSPFLDHKVMEFAAALDSSHKLHGRTLKYLLKKVAARFMPAEAIQRRKMGFGVPVGDWMRGELRPLLEETLLAGDARTRRYFDSTNVRALVDEHVCGRQDHSFQCWALLWLELWHREFLG